MVNRKLAPTLSAITFRILKKGTAAYNRLSLPVISTGRSFRQYRSLFFNNQSEKVVLAKFRGKSIADVGCGLTPYVSDSMFQACRRAGVAFYGIDPKLSKGFQLGHFDKFKVRASGGRGKFDPVSKGMDKAIGALADDLPFEDGELDIILSSFLLYVWITDAEVLERIFQEFLRVLKPGGQIMIFPTPHRDELQQMHAGLEGAMSHFDLKQHFVYQPPAYTTIYTKRQLVQADATPRTSQTQ